jgi:hypothetical protein
MTSRLALYLACLCSAKQGLPEHRNTKAGTASFGDQNINLCVGEILEKLHHMKNCHKGIQAATSFLRS